MLTPPTWLTLIFQANLLHRMKMLLLSMVLSHRGRRLASYARRYPLISQS
jgi:hypothetical protein